MHRGVNIGLEDLLAEAKLLSEKFGDRFMEDYKDKLHQVQMECQQIAQKFCRNL